MEASKEKVFKKKGKRILVDLKQKLKDNPNHYLAESWKQDIKEIEEYFKRNSTK